MRHERGRSSLESRFALGRILRCHRLAGESPFVIAPIVRLIGFVSGVGFGIILSFAERRKTILELSLSRVAMWGILGSAALPLLTGMENTLIFVVCPLGAVFASVSVAIARKAELHGSAQPKLLSSEPLPDEMATGQREGRFANSA